MTAEPVKIFDVVGLGVSTLDLMMVVDRLPGEELVQRARQTLLQGGGPVATAMVTLSRLGSPTAMVDKLGDDWRGRHILEEFQREGVSVDYIGTAEGRTSSIATILVRSHDGARTIIYAPGDAGEMSPGDLPLELLGASKILHLNGRHFDACMAFATKARERDVVVSFDGGADRFRPELNELIALTDICIVARQFAFSFSGHQALNLSAAKLLDSGPNLVVITAGAEGSWVYPREGESFHQPAFNVGSPVDTTGAGDAYHGAFLYGIAHDYDLRSCALLGSAVAALNTRQLGGRSALPDLDQVQQFLREQGVTL